MAERTCMEAALAKLNYRMRTESELKKALGDLDYDSEEIEKVIDELRSYGYVDDERYIREFYRTSRRKHWSRNRIARSLKEKGIGSGLIRDVLDEFEDSEEFSDLGLSSDERSEALKVGLDMMKSQISRGRPVDDSFLKKTGRRLTSLGYDTGCCFYVMNRLRDMAKELISGEEET